MKLYDFDTEALQMAADRLRKAYREAGETIQRVVESFKKAFNEAGKKYRIETDDPPVVVPEHCQKGERSAGEKGGEHQRGRFLGSESTVCSSIRSSG